ncbi:MAG: hypothetical protein M1821_007189 [Bathelium mastoideum]|nr:MAG: hypothetical protein M1821_007189 [Bathelium mastoideum]
MPLILISGFPSAGKTYRANQLHSAFQAKILSSSSSTDDARIARLTVHLVNDESLGLSRDVYHAARPEKDARAAAYSAVKRLLGRDAIVIADGLNYIKGFRYQLYCEAKAVRTPSCVVHVGTPEAKCREINRALLQDASKPGGYAEDDFDNLVFRYEEPNGMTRWDSPLFTVLYEDEQPPVDDIWHALIGSDGQAKAVRPNAATVLTPAAPSNLLYELNKTTSDVLAAIASYQGDHPGEAGGNVKVPGCSTDVELPAATVTGPQLQRLRRSFVALNRQYSLDPVRLKGLFVEYLNDEFLKMG